MAESAYSGIPLQSTRFDSRLKGMGAKFRNPDLDKLIDAIRVRAEGLGFTSTRQFQELFKVMDVDGRGMLDMGEFVKGLKDRGLVQTQEECDLIFLHFDEDRSGFIEPGEFLNAMKGNLSDRRRAVVREAFASMDANGDGVLTTEDLKMKYQSFSHPDITSGKRTEEEIFGEFLKSFDVISADGQITLSEFELYYESLSAMIKDDRVFINNVRNAWHLLGATGGSCLRVHITLGMEVQSKDANHHRRRHRDNFVTSQHIVEIRPALHCSPHDLRFMDLCRQRLATMGYPNVESIQVEAESFVDFMAAGALACSFCRFCEFNVKQLDSDAKAKNSYKIMADRAELLLSGSAREAACAAVHEVMQAGSGLAEDKL
ncbi:unnamed protein product [Polarella glacialis]|uniref:EF-hand domain-containing protein n=1 Tax=Polarella glacialis TaxID=89957 RepID=A0A813GK79_POLGL|nr:unnamed protein product [Polarella glacialis]